MKPPETVDVMDEAGQFTAELTGWYVLMWGVLPVKRLLVQKPVIKLKHGRIGSLDTYNEHAEFKHHSDVTEAYYKVPGYAFRAVVWFDNKTGKRLSKWQKYRGEDVMIPDEKYMFNCSHCRGKYFGDGWGLVFRGIAYQLCPTCSGKVQRFLHITKPRHWWQRIGATSSRSSTPRKY